MTRERRNVQPTAGERVRRRLQRQPELDLSEEELRALADERIDVDEVRRLARDRREQDEVSDFDRDTARDEVEGLVIQQEEEY